MAGKSELEPEWLRAGWAWPAHVAVAWLKSRDFLAPKSSRRPLAGCHRELAASCLLLDTLLAPLSLFSGPHGPSPLASLLFCSAGARFRWPKRHSTLWVGLSPPSCSRWPCFFPPGSYSLGDTSGVLGDLKTLGTRAFGAGKLLRVRARTCVHTPGARLSCPGTSALVFLFLLSFANTLQLSLWPSRPRTSRLAGLVGLSLCRHGRLRRLGTPASPHSFILLHTDFLPSPRCSRRPRRPRKSSKTRPGRAQELVTFAGKCTCATSVRLHPPRTPSFLTLTPCCFTDTFNSVGGPESRRSTCKPSARARHTHTYTHRARPGVGAARTYAPHPPTPLLPSRRHLPRLRRPQEPPASQARSLTAPVRTHFASRARARPVSSPHTSASLRRRSRLSPLLFALSGAPALAVSGLDDCSSARTRCAPAHVPSLRPHFFSATFSWCASDFGSPRDPPTARTSSLLARVHSRTRPTLGQTCNSRSPSSAHFFCCVADMFGLLFAHLDFRVARFRANRPAVHMRTHLGAGTPLLAWQSPRPCTGSQRRRRPSRLSGSFDASSAAMARAVPGLVPSRLHSLLVLPFHGGLDASQRRVHVYP